MWGWPAPSTGSGTEGSTGSGTPAVLLGLCKYNWQGREELREKMAVGTGQLDRGESIDEEAVFDEVEAEIRRIESLST